MHRPDLDEFNGRVRAIMAAATGPEMPAAVAGLIPELLATPDLLTAAQRAVPTTGYARHELFNCRDGLFSIVAVVWPPGIVTPIHDHLTWCAFGVLCGVIEETRYAPAHGDSECSHAVATGVFERFAGGVTHLPVDAPDIHSIRNPGDVAAITLHVYGGDTSRMGANIEKVYSLEA